MYVLACLGIFLAAYLINTTTISVLYHRGLAHGAVRLSPLARRFTATMGIWLTGLDPKGWVCMHRRHHVHSDTPKDPHSPTNVGIVGVLLAQLRSYERALVGLGKRDPEYAALVEDLDFPVSWLNRRRVWYVPYLAHLALVLAFGLATGWWAFGACYFLGIMSHPIEGWVINAFGHAVGGRNFDTPDNSRNNHVAAWLVLGEGYQNNHHRFPASARFSYRGGEFDVGYLLCRVLEKTGHIAIERTTLMPAYGTFPNASNDDLIGECPSSAGSSDAS